MPGLFITVDVEEPSHSNGRSWKALEPLVEALETRSAKATFFVVGSEITHWSQDLKRLSSLGHEIAIHGWSHVHLVKEQPLELLDNLISARSQLADLTGTDSVGFRAPYFSLTKNTSWVPEVLSEAGFKYSSSVLPALNPQAGFRSLPKNPFKWKSGLIEFPVPVFGVGPIAIPIAGGAYLRLLPKALINFAAHRLSAASGDWVYAHPYDFDVDERFNRWENMSWLTSQLLHARRGRMLEGVLNFADATVGTLGSSLDKFNDVATFDPWGQPKSVI